MLTLYNDSNKKKLKNDMFLKNEPRLILSFYKYFYIQAPKDFRDKIYKNFYMIFHENYNIFIEKFAQPKLKIP